MDPTIFVQLLVFGVLLGSIYGLVALGMTMIWGVMGVLNLAHGALMVVGMYTVWYASSRFGISPFVGVVLALVTVFAVGLLIHRTSIAPLIDAPDSNHLIVTLGWLLIVVATIQIVFSTTPRSLDVDLRSLELRGVFVPGARLFGLLITITAVVVMVLLLYKTHLGRAIRATADNRESAKYLGLHIERVDYLTFGIGAALAGLAGAVLPFIQRFDPFLGDFYLITAFVVAVLGGLGSFAGALVGGILVGMVQVFGAFYLPGSSNRILIFLIFIAVLVFRPTGLLGGEIRD